MVASDSVIRQSGPNYSNRVVPVKRLIIGIWRQRRHLRRADAAGAKRCAGY